MRSVVYHQFRKELHIIKTKFCISSKRSFAYHQNEVLHIIKPTVFIHTLRCDEIQRRLAAVDDIHANA